MLYKCLAAIPLAALLFLLPGCATSELSSAEEGTVPWNRPEKWEGPGILGSQMPQNQGF